VARGIQPADLPIDRDFRQSTYDARPEILHRIITKFFPQLGIAQRFEIDHAHLHGWRVGHTQTLGNRVEEVFLLRRPRRTRLVGRQDKQNPEFVGSCRLDRYVECGFLIAPAEDPQLRQFDFRLCVSLRQRRHDRRPIIDGKEAEQRLRVYKLLIHTDKACIPGRRQKARFSVG